MDLLDVNNEINGIINVLKPAGMTSHDVVGYVRKKLGKKVKAGHSGTLDPGAVGVLPVFLGRATRLIEFHDDSYKKYRAELTLGIESDSYDMFGELIYHEMDKPCKKADVLQAVSSFQGFIEQVPPRHSAIKINGQRAYDLARKGQEFTIKSRQVEIRAIELVCFDEMMENIESNKLVIDVECSKGTYIRSICHDIGQMLNTGAVMSFLIRTAAGPFKIEDSVLLEDISLDNLADIILPMDYGLTSMVRIDCSSEQKEAISHGRTVYFDTAIIQRSLPPESLCKDELKILAYSNDDGGLLAVCSLELVNEAYSAKPLKVFL